MKLGAAAALAFLGAVSTGAARADTIAVGPGGSIQAAVDLLLINSDPTDTVLVHPAVYPETVVIDFTGSNQQAMVIARAQKERPWITGGIRVRHARLVTLAGLKVSSSSADGQASIVGEDTTGFAVIDCVTPAGDEGGLDAQDCFEVVVIDSRFAGMERKTATDGFGVRIVGGCAHFLEDVEATGNEGPGIVVQADETELRRCEVMGNGTVGEPGLVLEGSRNLVKDGEYSGNGAHGIDVFGTARIKGATVRENDGAGIRVGREGPEVSAGGSVRGCTIKSNGKPGILVRSGHSGLEIFDNAIVKNSGAGIRLLGDRCHVRKNVIKSTEGGSAGGHGIVVEAGSRAHCIDANVFKGNTGHAVFLFGDDNYLLANLGKGGDGFVQDPSASGNDGRANVTNGPNDFP